MGSGKIQWQSPCLCQPYVNHPKVYTSFIVCCRSNCTPLLCPLVWLSRKLSMELWFRVSPSLIVKFSGHHLLCYQSLHHCQCHWYTHHRFEKHSRRPLESFPLVYPCMALFVPTGGGCFDRLPLGGFLKSFGASSDTILFFIRNLPLVVLTQSWGRQCHGRLQLQGKLGASLTRRFLERNILFNIA